MTVRLTLAQDADADALLSRNPLALLVGMVLDQQVTLEWAFTAPLLLTKRLGRDLDAADLASRDPDELAQLFATPPALHRYPRSMAARVQELCRVIVNDYAGDPSAVWGGVKDGRELLKRVRSLPGFGAQKAQIFVALLGKQLGVQPPGWRAAAGDYGAAGSRRSVADITDASSLAEVRDYKRSMKAKAKAKAQAS